MGSCISLNRKKSKVVVGIKTRKDAYTSTHLEEKIFRIKENRKNNVYYESKKLDSPPFIFEGSCTDSDCGSQF